MLRNRTPFIKDTGQLLVNKGMKNNFAQKVLVRG